MRWGARRQQQHSCCTAHSPFSASFDADLFFFTLDMFKSLQNASKLLETIQKHPETTHEANLQQSECGWQAPTSGRSKSSYKLRL